VIDKVPFMSRITMSILALVMLGPVLAAEPELCSSYPRKIEPDMQIKESDLSTAAALNAVKNLERDLASASRAQDFGTLNRLKIVLGYTLRRQALEDAAQFGATSEQSKTSTAAFCSWLVEKGFRYD
jgi:hypothetical protein